jgi:DNA-binding SARP family transcriptional activator/TolB-like protein
VFWLRTLGGLWIERQDGSRDPTPRPRRLALLAIVAAAGRKGASREQVLAILWPEADAERGRHALSQTLYSLRRDLGDEVVVADGQTLRLDPAALRVDLVDFRAAVAEHAWDRAAELYGGDFLEGFYLDAAPEFERWVESERAGLAEDARRALAAAAERAGRAGATAEAVGYWSKLVRTDPLSAQHAVSYMEALAAAGDPSRALAHARVYEALVSAELGVPPDARVMTLAERLRHGVQTPQPPSEPPAPERAPAPAPAPLAPTDPRVPAPAAGRRRRGFWIAAAVVGLVALALVALDRWAGRLPPSAGPVIAVGALRDLAGPDSARLGGVLTEMLTTSLSRLTNLDVIANTRLLELLPRNGGDGAVGRTEAARLAGATEVLEGELTSLRGRGLELELRLVDLATGRVKGGYRVGGPDRFAVVDSVTALVAADLRLSQPLGGLAEVTTHSPIAYRLYEEGLRAFYQGDAVTARQLFRSATQEDSTFALAAYYTLLSDRALSLPEADSLRERVRRLAFRADDRDRLVILAHTGSLDNDPASLAYADSIARRFPSDPEALLRAGEAMTNRDPGQAIALLNRAVAIDSAAGLRVGAVCRLCSSFETMERNYLWLDSLPSAERTLVRWQRLTPNDLVLWSRWGDYLLRTKGWSASQPAYRRADSLRGESFPPPWEMVVRLMIAEEYGQAERQCGTGGAQPVTVRAQLRWYCTILLRTLGRRRAAVRLNRSGLWGDEPIYAGLPVDDISAAILAFDTGDPRRAAAGFAAIAKRWASSVPAGTRARNVVWYLTLSGTALAAAGDTAAVRRLADSVAAIGPGSAFARDPKLHFFLEGLLAAAAGDQARAVELYRQAASSYAFGYTRINYELARSLLALGRPREALYPLEAALRGGIDGSNTYLTRTEVHELLGRAFAAAGLPDSAAVQYSAVARAWSHADPELASRVAAARAFRSPVQPRSSLRKAAPAHS